MRQTSRKNVNQYQISKIGTAKSYSASMPGIGSIGIGALFTTAGPHDPARGALGLGLELKAHPHMLRHACGCALANKGHDARAIQGWLGHRSITSTAVYTALAPNRFKDFWRE